MQDITGFIRSLGNEEKRIVRRHLASSPFRGEQDTKERKLFALLSQRKAPSGDDALAKAAGCSTSDPRFRKLRSRLFNKVLEALTLDPYLEKEHLFPEADRAVIRLKKKMLQFRILHRSGGKVNSAILFHLLNDVIHTGKKYEVFDVVTEALYFKKYMSGNRLGRNKYELLDREVNRYDSYYKALQRANDLYTRFVINSGFAARFTGSQLQETLEEAVRQLKRDQQETRSVRIAYYLRRLQLVLYQSMNDHNASSDCCLDLISLMKKNPVVYRRERMGFVYDYLCRTHIIRREYSRALAAARTARKYYPSGGFNHFASLEQEFLARFYSGEFEKSAVVVDQLLHHPSSDTGQFRKDRAGFYLACIRFCERDPRTAASLVDKALQLSKDKARWGLAARILRIMCCVEMKDPELASFHVEALRKNLERMRTKYEVSPRDKLIYECLYYLDKVNFEPAADDQRAHKHYIRLAGRDPVLAWKPFSHELIPFHRWLQGLFVKKKKSRREKQLMNGR